MAGIENLMGCIWPPGRSLSTPVLRDQQTATVFVPYSAVIYNSSQSGTARSRLYVFSLFQKWELLPFFSQPEAFDKERELNGHKVRSVLINDARPTLFWFILDVGKLR